MTKSDIIKEVADGTGLTKVEIEYAPSVLLMKFFCG